MATIIKESNRDSSFNKRNGDSSFNKRAAGVSTHKREGDTSFKRKGNGDNSFNRDKANKEGTRRRTNAVDDDQKSVGRGSVARSRQSRGSRASRGDEGGQPALELLFDELRDAEFRWIASMPVEEMTGRRFIS